MPVARGRHDIVLYEGGAEDGLRLDFLEATELPPGCARIVTNPAIQYGRDASFVRKGAVAGADAADRDVAADTALPPRAEPISTASWSAYGSSGCARSACTGSIIAADWPRLSSMSPGSCSAATIAVPPMVRPKTMQPHAY